MKSKIKVPKEILATIDFNNTVMGGSVEPIIKINEAEESFEINVSIPSLSPDTLKVDIVDNKLWVYSLQEVLVNTDMTGFMPKTIANLFLPENIDRDNISAKYELNSWKIVLPKDGQKKSFRKQIDIEY
jgi:HSP20 family molecular chaperone IbpA